MESRRYKDPYTADTERDMMDLVKQAMLLEAKWGIRVHLRFTGKGEPLDLEAPYARSLVDHLAEGQSTGKAKIDPDTFEEAYREYP